MSVEDFVPGQVWITHDAPEGGWLPEHFPQITVDLIPYTSTNTVTGDPRIVIDTEGWMHIELGNVRIALPNRDEWAKLVHMGEALWNQHDALPVKEE